MFRPLRLVLLFVTLVFAQAPASAQINWTVTYSDNNGTIVPGAFGFSSGTAAGSTTVGQLRRDSVTAATNYWSSVLDGRGTIAIRWNPSLNNDITGGGTLGSFAGSGSSGFTEDGYFIGGRMYQRGRTDTAFGGDPAGQGRVNFHTSARWHYQVPNTNTTLSNTTIDLVSVLAHEIGHGLGVVSGVRDPSTGRGGNPAGTAPDFLPPNPFVIGTNGDWYKTFDIWLQRGNGAYATSALFNTNVTQSNFATFASPASTFTGGNENPNGNNASNNTTTGLYFGGPFTREVFGGPVPLFAPAIYQDGSSVSHTNVPSPQIGLLNWSISNNTTRRLQPYEIGMLLDMGWNVYNWNNTTANWKDGVVGSTLTVANSKWTSDKGIILAADGFTSYNTFSTQAQAPVLPPYGQVTSNIVLNFGSSPSAYTSTNDIGTLLVTRLNLNSSLLTAANTIAGGTLSFGMNSDGTASVLAPKIVQQGNGAFTINSNIQTNNVATVTTAATAGGVTFPGSPGLTIDGTGNGTVTLNGVISGGISSLGGFNQTTATGSLTKAGPFTAILTGNNTYGGGTTVTAGTLLANGQTGSNSGTGTGPVEVNGGTLGGNGRIAGAVTVNSGGTLAPGSSGPGTLKLGGGVTFNSGSTFAIEVNGATAGTQHDQLDVTGSVALGSATLSRTLGGGYSPAGSSDLLFIIVNDGGDVVSGTFNGLANGASFLLGSTTAYISYEGDFDRNAISGGNDVVIAFVPIPEPGAVLGIAAGVLTLGAIVRRSRRHLRIEPAVAIAP